MIDKQYNTTQKKNTNYIHTCLLLITIFVALRCGECCVRGGALRCVACVRCGALRGVLRCVRCVRVACAALHAACVEEALLIELMLKIKRQRANEERDGTVREERRGGRGGERRGEGSVEGGSPSNVWRRGRDGLGFSSEAPLVCTVSPLQALVSHSFLSCSPLSPLFLYIYISLSLSVFTYHVVIHANTLAHLRVHVSCIP